MRDTSKYPDTCQICGEKSFAGILTDGDPYSDGPFVGIPLGPMVKTCPKCKGKYPEKVPDFDEEIDAAFKQQGLCGFLEAYQGRCRNKKPCQKHQDLTCWKCGEKATRNCPTASSFVCGQPCCNEHFPHCG